MFDYYRRESISLLRLFLYVMCVTDIINKYGLYTMNLVF